MQKTGDWLFIPIALVLPASDLEPSCLSLRLDLRLKKETAADSVLTHHRTEAGHPPQRQVDGGGVVVHQIGKAQLQQGGGLPGVVVRNAWVDVMAQVSGTDAVVQQV